MNRNIITPADVASSKPSLSTRGEPSPVGDTPKVDDYLAKLIKQIPFDIISAYLVLDGIIKSGLAGDNSALFRALLVTFALGTLATYFFSLRVLRVRRQSQLTATCGAFAVWVFATGGWFALTDWYQPWMGSASVVIFAMLVRIAKVPPLPDETPSR